MFPRKFLLIAALCAFPAYALAQSASGAATGGASASPSGSSATVGSGGSAAAGGTSASTLGTAGTSTGGWHLVFDGCRRQRCGRQGAVAVQGQPERDQRPRQGDG